MSAVIYYMVFINNGQDTIRALRIPILFVVMLLVDLITLVYTRLFYNTVNFSGLIAKFIGCALKNYDGTDSYKNVCGDRVEYFISLPFFRWFLFCFAGMGIFLSAIFMGGLWYKIFKGIYSVAASKVVRSSQKLMPSKLVVVSASRVGPDGRRHA